MEALLYRNEDCAVHLKRTRNNKKKIKKRLMWFILIRTSCLKHRYLVHFEPLLSTPRGIGGRPNPSHHVPARPAELNPCPNRVKMVDTKGIRVLFSVQVSSESRAEHDVTYRISLFQQRYLSLLGSFWDDSAAFATSCPPTCPSTMSEPSKTLKTATVNDKRIMISSTKHNSLEIAHPNVDIESPLRMANRIVEKVTEPADCPPF